MPVFSWLGPNRHAIVVLLLALLPACGPKAPASPSGEASPQEAVPLVQRLRAAAAESALAPYQTIRYNPAPESCACPPFEIRIAERWWRVYLEPKGAVEESPLPALETRAAAALADGKRPHYHVAGVLYDDPQALCPNGRYGFELQLTEARDVPPPSAPGP